MKRKLIGWSVSLPNCDQVASKVPFDRLKGRRNKKDFWYFLSLKEEEN
ncbi:MAG: hypothetical protein RSC81_01185 [Myroides sp.]